MKINAVQISLCILLISPIATRASTSIPTTDSLCCAPQILTLVSSSATQFCVSWSLPTGSTCITPYGFLVQWSAMPTSTTRNEAIVLYSGTNLHSLCEALPSCGKYQLRIKTLCDSSQTGRSSNWVYLQNVGVACN